MCACSDSRESNGTEIVSRGGRTGQILRRGRRRNGLIQPDETRLNRTAMEKNLGNFPSKGSSGWTGVCERTSVEPTFEGKVTDRE